MSVKIVAVMAKHPELSKVKTRLASTIGDSIALEIYKILLENMCNNCLPKNKSTYSLGCFLTPFNFVEEFKSMYGSFDFYKPQSGDNLGQRMHHAFNTIFSNHKADKSILIGADIPDLDRDIIEIAFSELNSYDIVIGPTDDGGYYLIGMKKTPSVLFDNISWGTSKVLDETLAVCKNNSLTYQLLKPLSDIDTQQDLESFPNISKKMQ